MMYRATIYKYLVDWVLLLLVGLFWGSSFILMKKGLQVFSAQEVGALRIFSAAVLLLPWSLSWLRRLCWHHYRYLLLVGLVGSLMPVFLFAKAGTQLDSAINGVLIALTPIFTLLLGRLCFQRPIFRREVWGSLLGLVGALLLVLAGTENGVGRVNYYVLLPMLGCVCYGFNANLLKKYLQDLSTHTIISVSFLLIGIVTGVMLFTQTAFLFKLNNVAGAYRAMGCVLTLGALGSALAFILFTQLVKRTSPVFASMATCIVPLVALGWGLLDGEVLLLGHYVGTGIILMGVYLVIKKRQ